MRTMFLLAAILYAINCSSLSLSVTKPLGFLYNKLPDYYEKNLRTQINTMLLNNKKWEEDGLEKYYNLRERRKNYGKNFSFRPLIPSLKILKLQMQVFLEQKNNAFDPNGSWLGHLHNSRGIEEMSKFFAVAQELEISEAPYENTWIFILDYLKFIAADAIGTKERELLAYELIGNEDIFFHPVFGICDPQLFLSLPPRVYAVGVTPLPFIAYDSSSCTAFSLAAHDIQHSHDVAKDSHEVFGKASKKRFYQDELLEHDFDYEKAYALQTRILAFIEREPKDDTKAMLTAILAILIREDEYLVAIEPTQLYNAVKALYSNQDLTNKFYIKTMNFMSNSFHSNIIDPHNFLEFKNELSRLMIFFKQHQALTGE